MVLLFGYIYGNEIDGEEELRARGSRKIISTVGSVAEKEREDDATPVDRIEQQNNRDEAARARNVNTQVCAWTRVCVCVYEQDACFHELSEPKKVWVRFALVD